MKKYRIHDFQTKLKKKKKTKFSQKMFEKAYLPFFQDTLISNPYNATLKEIL